MEEGKAWLFEKAPSAGQRIVCFIFFLGCLCVSLFFFGGGASLSEVCYGEFVVLFTVFVGCLVFCTASMVFLWCFSCVIPQDA